MTGLLSAAELAEIRQDYRDGMETVQDFQDPPAIVTFRRRDRTTGEFGDVLDVQLIRIGFPDRQDQTAGENAGLVETDTVGELKGWAPLPIYRDDVFGWDGRTCIVTAVQPARLGVVKASFVLKQGGPPV